MSIITPYCITQSSLKSILFTQINCADLQTNVLQVSPLHLAAQFSSAQVVNALIDAGADLEAVDDQNSRPLHLAARFDQSGIVVRALIKAGANVEERDNQGDSPLHKAVRFNQCADV